MRRPIVIGIASALAVLLVAAGVTAAYLVDRHDRQRADRYRHELADAKSRNADLAAANRGSYDRGYDKGLKVAHATQKLAGDTYNKGYTDGLKDGYSATLGGFDSWNDSGWYLVKIKATGKAATPYEVNTRTDVPRCRWQYVDLSDQVYGGAAAC